MSLLHLINRDIIADVIRRYYALCQTAPFVLPEGQDISQLPKIADEVDSSLPHIDLGDGHYSIFATTDTRDGLPCLVFQELAIPAVVGQPVIGQGDIDRVALVIRSKSLESAKTLQIMVNGLVHLCAKKEGLASDPAPELTSAEEEIVRLNGLLDMAMKREALLKQEITRLTEGIKKRELTMIVDGNDMYDWGWDRKTNHENT